MNTFDPIELHLRVRIKPGYREAFVAFVRGAIPFYTAPGGIEIRLLADSSDDHRFIELVVYDDEAAYRRDQQRVAQDPEMKRYLVEWRELLVEPPVVELYRLLEI